MLSALRRAVTQPASFFEQESRDPGLLQPAIVVGLVALFGLVSSIPVFQATFSALPEEAGVIVAVVSAIGAVFGVIVPFVVWLVYAVLFYLLSLAFDSSGEFRDLFAVIGWGFAPRIVSSVVSAVVLFLVFSGQDFGDPTQVQQFRRTFPTSPLGLASQAVGILTSLWSAWIWTYGVATTRDLTTRQAGIVVGVIVGLGILLGLGSAFLFA